MRIRMQSGAELNSLSVPGWDLAIVGNVVDDRGKASIAFCRDHAQSTIRALYDPDGIMVDVGQNRYSADDLEAFMESAHDSSILLEATTLGLVEIFLFCRAAKDVGVSAISLLYAEPKAYSVNRSQVLHKRDFELSDEVADFTGVPGAVLLRELTRTRVVFLVGYEGQRLEQALEQTGASPSDCSIVFGVPAFQPGWEMDSFANNIKVIRDRRICELSYTGAQNPAGAYAVLEKLRASCDPGQRMLVSPIGTKPHGIGAALFACSHNDVGLLYDNPTRRQGRTSEVAMWHLFEAELVD